MNKENILKNIQTLAAMKELDGATLKNNKPIHYENGYQVASKSMIITRSIVLAAVTIEKNNGNCGIWLENGIYYIDHSHHIKTLEKALELGKRWEQISIYSWEENRCIYCND